jgi:DNA-binding transcriptional regulator/RsmH inhibitor MraZ
MASDFPTQTLYAGNYRHSIDEKNRLTIPSRWRKGEAEEFIMLPDPRGQFLLVMSPEEFTRMTLALETNDSITADQRRLPHATSTRRRNTAAPISKAGSCCPKINAASSA